MNASEAAMLSEQSKQPDQAQIDLVFKIIKDAALSSNRVACYIPRGMNYTQKANLFDYLRGHGYDVEVISALDQRDLESWRIKW